MLTSISAYLGIRFHSLHPQTKQLNVSHPMPGTALFPDFADQFCFLPLTGHSLVYIYTKLNLINYHFSKSRSFVCRKYSVWRWENCSVVGAVAQQVWWCTCVHHAARTHIGCLYSEFLARKQNYSDVSSSKSFYWKFCRLPYGLKLRTGVFYWSPSYSLGHSPESTDMLV